MKNEQIAVIALIIIIAGALTVFFISTNQDDIFGNLFPTGEKQEVLETVIQEGDCVDINYIGRYATNNTVFDSSYEDYAEKTGGIPLNIYIPSDTQATAPETCVGYTSSFIPGLMDQLVGKELGETYVLDPIPPEDAYGEEISVGDIVHSIVFNQNIIQYTSFINQTLEVVEKTDTNMNLKWIDPPTEPFTLPSIIIFGSLDLTSTDPSYDDVLEMAPPFALWENATEIIETTDDYYLTKTTPTSTENLTDSITQIPLDLLGGSTLFVFPDATTVTYDETQITFHLDPEEGKVYSYTEQSMFGEVSIQLTINRVTDDLVNITVFMAEYNQSISYDLEREMSFNRTYEYPRIYDMDLDFLQQALPQFLMDLEREGFSISDLAGETLIFEITVEDITKPSQEDS